MTFVDIPVGSAIFLDANILVYYFAANPVLGPFCRDLLERISRSEVLGYTTSDILSDVAHRVMTIEAVNVYGWPMTGIAFRLKRQPVEVQALTYFRKAVEDVQTFGVQVLPVTEGNVLAAAVISQQFGLLSGDALAAAVMQANGLNQLASHDADFDRVPWLTRFAPV